MTRAQALALAGVLWAAPALGQPLRIGVVNLEQGDLRERLEEAVLFSLDFAGLDYEPILFRPARPEDAIEPLASAMPDLVVTIGSMGPRLAVLLPPSIPVIATAVGHPASFTQGQRAPAGTSHYVPPARQLAFFRKVLPGLRRLGVLVDMGDDEALRLLPETQHAAAPLDITILVRQIAKAQDLSDAAESLLPAVDALLLLGSFRTASGVSDVLSAATRRRRPIFAFNEEMVRRGAVAALYADRLTLAEEVGPMAKRLLAQKVNPADLEVRTLPIFKIALNLASARTLGLRLPYKLLVIANEIVR